MTFRNKILFSIWGVVLSLLVITFFIINYWIRSRVENTFANELRASFSTIQVLSRLQAETLERSCLIIAESPRLRAVAELGDPSTAYELSRELAQNTLSNLFVLTDRRGAPLAQIRDGRSFPAQTKARESIQHAMEKIATSDIWAIDGTAYRVVSAPILLGPELIGTLTVGFRVSPQDIATLKQATGSNIVLLLDESPILSTFDTTATRTLVAAAAPQRATVNTLADSACSVFRISAGGDIFLATRIRLNRSLPGDTSLVSFLVTKPFSAEVRQSMASIFNTFGFVALGFLALTTLIGVVISRGMTRPITELVRGTSEVSRGNYDYAINVRGKGELGFLAGKFMEMSRSLKEKIAELARLNLDLTERNADLDATLKVLRETQQELIRNERLAATGKLTAQLAHEINNPIHNIQSLLKTSLSRLPQEARGRELIIVAFDEVNRMSRLTRQMLDIYRSSFVEVRLQPTSLNEVLQEVIAFTQEELVNSGIAVNSAIDPQLPLVQGSKDKLKQVLLNIVANARDAMPGGGTLSITAKPECGFVNIEIGDTGVGIPAENLGRIFDAFFTTKEKVSGVGLGLSVCHGIVSQHDGKISVRSKPGEGSTFIVSLPHLSENAT